MTTCAVHGEREASGICVRCDRPLCPECQQTLDGRSYCAGCVEELERKRAARAEGFGLESQPAPELAAGSSAPITPSAGDAGLLKPLLFALFAGGVGAVVWFQSVVLSEYKLGLIAVGVGWLVGFATLKGAGGRGGPALALMSLGVALAAMFLGEYLIVNHFALAAVAEQDPNATLPTFIPLGVFFAVYRETLGGMDLLFYGFGAYEAWKLPTAAKKA